MTEITAEDVKRAQIALDSLEVPAGPRNTMLTRQFCLTMGADPQWLAQFKAGETITLADGSTIYLLD